jgi:hypothetical protein
MITNNYVYNKSNSQNKKIISSVSPNKNYLESTIKNNNNNNKGPILSIFANNNNNRD